MKESWEERKGCAGPTGWLTALATLVATLVALLLAIAPAALVLGLSLAAMYIVLGVR